MNIDLFNMMVMKCFLYYFHSHIFVACGRSLLLTPTCVMNSASILLRKANFPPAVEEELPVLKNISPLYVVMPFIVSSSHITCNPSCHLGIFGGYNSFSYTINILSVLKVLVHVPLFVMDHTSIIVAF